MNKKPEKSFEIDLELIAPVFGCLYIKIQDTRAITRDNRRYHKEVKRICDAIIITKTANWFCECKIESAPLRDHQEWLRKKCFEYNGKFVILRKYVKESGSVYRITTKWGEWKTTAIEDIFKLLSDL